MAKYWTTNIEEYLANKSLIFIRPDEYATLKSIKIPKPHRCEYCKDIFPNKNSKYCSDWCREMGGSIHLLLSYNCNKCGKPIPYQTTVCSDCKRKKKPKIKKERPHKYKTTMTEDSVGHLCKKCGIYKEWKFFPTSNGKHTPRCKECCKKDQLAYYHKNKIKINEKKKIKNQQSKIK